MTNQALRVAPWNVVQTISIDRMFAEVVTAGNAGAVYRLGIYASTSEGEPGALVLDAGTIDAATTGVKEASFAAVTLDPGRYWVGGVSQNAATTAPIMRTTGTGTVDLHEGSAALPAVNAFIASSNNTASVAGALPNPYVPSGSPAGVATRIGIRTALRDVFDGDFARRSLTAYNTTIHSERVSFVADPVLGSARTAIQMTVLDTDTVPTENPRAQLETRFMLGEGDEAWHGFALYLPNDWPTLPTAGWVTFASIYGPPFNDAGPLRFTIEAGDGKLGWRRDADYSNDTPWSMSLLRGQWVDLAMHVKMSTNPAIGFVEIWRNIGDGWQQQRLGAGNVTRLSMSTLGSANNGGDNNARINLYRKVGMFTSMTCYFSGHRVDTSLAAVDPHSYDWDRRPR